MKCQAGDTLVLFLLKSSYRLRTFVSTSLKINYKIYSMILRIEQEGFKVKFSTGCESNHSH